LVTPAAAPSLHSSESGLAPHLDAVLSALALHLYAVFALLRASPSVLCFPWKLLSSLLAAVSSLAAYHLLAVPSLDSESASAHHHHLRALPSFVDPALAPSILFQDFDLDVSIPTTLLDLLSVEWNIALPQVHNNFVECTLEASLYDGFDTRSSVALSGYIFYALPSVVPLAYNACCSSDSNASRCIILDAHITVVLLGYSLSRSSTAVTLGAIRWTSCSFGFIRVSFALGFRVLVLFAVAL